MNRLEKIQKIVKVFKILTLIAMILTYVFAGMAMVGAVTFTAVGKENFMEIFGSTISSEIYSQPGTSYDEVCADLWCSGIAGLFEGAVLAAVLGYLKTELADGTPFTENGAEKLRKLGITVIILPIISAVVCIAVSKCYHVNMTEDVSNLTELIFGIAMIIISIIFGYGAELESKVKAETE